jgi:hypothetical protein
LAEQDLIQSRRTWTVSTTSMMCNEHAYASRWRLLGLSAGVQYIA